MTGLGRRPARRRGPRPPAGAARGAGRRRRRRIAQPPHQLLRARQIGDMRQPDDRHLRRHHRARRRRHLLERLQQHLPAAVSTRIDEPPGEVEPRARSPAPRSDRRPPRAPAAAATPNASARQIAAAPPAGRPRPDRARASSASAAAASPRITPRTDRATRPRSAIPSISRTSLPRRSPAPCAIAWSSSDSASRTEPSAARAISASASGVDRDPFRLGDPREMRRSSPPARPAAARNAGSATAPSPAPCGSRSSRR